MAKKKAAEDAPVEEVELTEDEKDAALKAALQIKLDAMSAEAVKAEADEAAKKVAEEAEAEAVKAQAEKEAAAVARKAEPHKFVGLVLEGMVEPDYHPNAGDTKDRTITIGNQVFEHTHEDADGVWLYRHFGR
jgi:hypothetical protein